MKPKVTLKACNYNVLPYNKIRDTVWENVDDNKVKIDTSELEDLFARAAPKKEEKTSSQSSIQLTDPKKKEPVKLLGSDRWRNFEIVLTKLKLPEGAIAEALTFCEGKYALPQVLETVSKIMPTEDE